MIKRTVTVVFLSVVMLIATAALAGLTPAASHDSHDGETVRIMARLRATGSIEFGLRSSQGPQLPRLRYLVQSVNDGAWKRSSPVELPNGAVVRIIARRATGERAEFGLRTDDPSQQFLPPLRYFPRDATVDNEWLFSTPMLIPAQHTEDEAHELAPLPEDAETQGDSDPNTEYEDNPNATDPDVTGQGVPADPDVERLVGGHRDGLIVNRNVVGDPDAPVVIFEFGDPY